MGEMVVFGTWVAAGVNAPYQGISGSRGGFWVGQSASHRWAPGPLLINLVMSEDKFLVGWQNWDIQNCTTDQKAKFLY